MLANDTDEYGISDEGIHDIVAGTESSLFSIKKQLLTVQTLRTELCRKEDIIFALNDKISMYERDESLTNNYYDENRMLIDRSQRLEKAVENSHKERSLSGQQLLIQIQLSESLRNEVEQFSKELSDTRIKSDHHFREVSILNQRISDAEEKLRISQDLNHSLRLEVRKTELMAAEIRNLQSNQSIITEQNIQSQKEKNLVAERNILEYETRLEDKERMIKLWIGRHDSVATQLSEQQIEAEHWKRTYSELEDVVQALTDFSTGVRSHHIHEKIDLENELELTIKKSDAFQRDLTDIESALGFISTELKTTAGIISSSDILSSTDLNLSNIRNGNISHRKMIQNFQNNFSLNYINIPVLDEIMNMVCILLNDKSSNQVQRYDLSVELQRSGQTVDETAFILENMEIKYKLMKSKVFEAKVLIDKQGVRYQELLTDFSVLNNSKDVNESMILNSLSEDLDTEKYLRGEEEKKFLNEIRGLEIKLENTENRLNDTVVCVETIAEYLISLEKKYREISIEKKIRKKMCSMYENLKLGVSNIAKEVIRISGYTEDFIRVSGYPGDPNIMDFRISENHRISNININDKVDISSGNGLDDNLFKNNLNYSKNSIIAKKNKQSLRVVVIFILASLRFFKIMQKTILNKRKHISVMHKNEISSISFLKKLSIGFMSEKIENMINENISFPTLISLIACKNDNDVFRNNEGSVTNETILIKKSLCHIESMIEQYARRKCETTGIMEQFQRREIENLHIISELTEKIKLLEFTAGQYSEEQRDLLTALQEAETTLQEKIPPTPVSPIRRNGTLEYSPHSKIYSPTGGTDTLEYSSNFNQEHQYDPHLSYNDMKSNNSNKNSLYNIKNSLMRSAVQRDPVSSRDISVIENESDSVLGDILRALASPLKNGNSPLKFQYKSPYTKNEKKENSSEKNDKFSKSFSSYLSPDDKNKNYSRSKINDLESPSGRTYIEKMIAGDAKHVSVALRAYAMSVVEEEKIINMSRNEHYYKPNSNPNYSSGSKSSRYDNDREGNENKYEHSNGNRYEHTEGYTNRFEHSRTYSEDEIIAMVQ